MASKIRNIIVLPFVDFLREIDIDPLTLINETGGSIKQGISFENWNGDNKKYFHGFYEKFLSNTSIPPLFSHDCGDYYYKHLIHNKLDFNEYSYAAKLSYQNKIDLSDIAYAIHFDTNRLSTYLGKIAKERNIEYIEGDFKKIKLKYDFIFDCSGLSRLIIGKKTKWKSYRKYLPMKQAIPFHLSVKENKPYTSAIAMKYGWMWQIPLKDRIGAGYVFDSDYINAKEAQKEAEQFLGHKIDVRKIINFEAGRHEQYWVDNCMAVGLSACFIEPLESTSIHLTVLQLQLLRQFANNLFDGTNDMFNEVITNTMDEILYFVYLHYITKRKDTEFWKRFNKDYPCPPEFKSVLKAIKNNDLKHYDIKSTNRIQPGFSVTSYLQIANGLKLFNKKINIKEYENLVPSVDQVKELIDLKSQSL
jgi:tryptophan halogenase